LKTLQIISEYIPLGPALLRHEPFHTEPAGNEIQEMVFYCFGCYITVSAHTMTLYGALCNFNLRRVFKFLSDIANRYPWFVDIWYYLVVIVLFAVLAAVFL